MSQRSAASPLGRIFAYPYTLSTKNFRQGRKFTHRRLQEAHMMLTPPLSPTIMMSSQIRARIHASERILTRTSADRIAIKLNFREPA
jgi:hypothetical protein